ncbi:MAG: UbiA prenyltransferase family protein [Prevotella sp.]|nr:UbiA prenyltransferase family protein [Prevotella sp.]
MNDYIRIMRLDHWVKQLFVLPGVFIAVLLTHRSLADTMLWQQLTIGLLSVSFIASANYVINEWLDAGSDRFHPVKKYRAVVSGHVRGSVVWILWLLLTALGMGCAWLVNKSFAACAAWLWLMGILYNVRPIRTKDIPVVDVLSESLNNAIRLFLGWFVISPTLLPPCSIVLGYWMVGAYLMATKRFAEYRMIGNKAEAAQYRKSFRYYNEVLLLTSAFFYALLSVFFIGTFLVKYRTELLLFIPFLIGVYCYYLRLAFDDDSSVQKPEKLYREHRLMIYCIFLVLWFVFLLFCDIPWLRIFTNDQLIAF